MQIKDEGRGSPYNGENDLLVIYNRELAYNIANMDELLCEQISIKV